MTDTTVDANIRALFFDLDGTLVDSAADIRRSLNLVLATRGLPVVADDQVRRWVGRGADRLLACVVEALQLPDTLHAPLLADFLDVYAAHVCVDSTVYPGVVRCLQQACARGLHLACITNKPLEPALALLAALNLAPYFSLVLGGDSLAHKKPHPQPLQHALAHYGLTSDQALMVGDSRNDVEAAHAANMRCVAVPYGYNHGEDIAQSRPDLLLDSLARLF